ncbi:hypothetical protein [Pseudomonas sp. R37(2017)]|uniref:hypothetical protein n=1 Tax=Pseudomonas sp. R37(2017) TaxID=1981685 RepID=UPI000A1FC869|nr:hypothetical protein [Pseudomonas sp. R37(2017)]
MAEHGIDRDGRPPLRLLHYRREASAAEPLPLLQVGRIADWLERTSAEAPQRGDHSSVLRAHRDRALLLLGVVKYA